MERETHHVNAPAGEQRRILVLVPVVTNEGTVTRVMLGGVGVSVTRLRAVTVIPMTVITMMMGMGMKCDDECLVAAILTTVTTYPSLIGASKLHAFSPASV